MSEKENKENQVKETAGTKKEEKVIKEVKKETTLLSTKEIRDGMKKFKHIYFNTKEGLLN